MFSLDFPCVSGELDDKVFIAQESFKYQSPVPPVPRKTLPFCRHDDELMDHAQGRWMMEPWPNQTQCPNAFAFDPVYRKRNQITANNHQNPHCWHRDDLTVVGYVCGEMNCKFIWPESRWMSTFRQKQWMGVWRNYDCDYVEFTDNQLQTCINKKKISAVKFDGASVAEILNQFVSLRLQNIQMYNSTANDSVTVTLSTLKLLHLTTQIDSVAIGRWKTAYKNITEDPRSIVYIVNGFYLTSERETFCFVERMRRYNYQLEEHFLPKGYHVLNAFDLSKAVSYETAGQFDGMHLTGPAIKMVTVKFFHHLCQDVVEGARL